MHPYLLKEYRNRWYLIGKSELKEKVITFGLDRIFDPLLLEQNFVIESNFSLCKVIERAGIESLPNAVVMLFKNSSAFTPLCSVTTALFSSLIYTPYEMLI